MTRDQYVDSLKEIFIDLGMGSIRNYLSSALYFLGFLKSPIISIIMFFVFMILKFLIKETETQLFFYYIDTRTDKQAKEFNDAIIKNIEVGKNGNTEEIQKSKDLLIDSFRNLVKLKS
jgi:hypothetical protein